MAFGWGFGVCQKHIGTAFILGERSKRFLSLATNRLSIQPHMDDLSKVPGEKQLGY